MDLLRADIQEWRQPFGRGDTLSENALPMCVGSRPISHEKVLRVDQNGDFTIVINAQFSVQG